MSWCVDLLVCFRCLGGRSIRHLAQRHPPAIASAAAAEAALGVDYHLRHRFGEADLFSASMSEGQGVTGGANSGTLSWGIVGDYTNPPAFVEALRPFCEELLSAGDGKSLDEWDGSLNFDAVLVVFQGGRDPTAAVLQIARAYPRSPATAVAIRGGPAVFRFWREDDLDLRHERGDP